ncbi:hypothetical protein GCM10023189_06570 [Nibrella saemangeumensis]|uniref:Uncharacterized protein n=1 Tax=Nibrella saemangeumensis TaxID=1084526 RepID=A0ABP8MEW8_9BACT
MERPHRDEGAKGVLDWNNTKCLALIVVSGEFYLPISVYLTTVSVFFGFYLITYTYAFTKLHLCIRND